MSVIPRLCHVIIGCGLLLPSLSGQAQTPICQVDPDDSNLGTHSGPLTVPRVLISGVLFWGQIHEQLPAGNTNILPKAINGVSCVDDLAGRYQQALSEGYIQHLGGFTVTAGSLPSTPPGYPRNGMKSGLHSHRRPLQKLRIALF